jgi:NADPH:quinone reductase-like Zn-dependent oxidoreductase
MKAVLLYEHGGPEVLQYGDFATPEPGPGQVLVRLKAAALNHLDLWTRAGWPGLKLEYPHILGADGAGEVAAVGAGVEGWSPGERVVINSNLSCGHCEYCIAGQSLQELGSIRRDTPRHICPIRRGASQQHLSYPGRF